MKNLPQTGTFTVTRAVNGLDGDRIRIVLNGPNGKQIIEMTPEDFGLAVTGLSERPCTITTR